MKFALLSAVAGAVGFGIIYGPHVLDPTYIDWLMAGDSATNYVGWTFFRNSSWSFPLGDIPELIFPMGTSVAHQDSIPLFAILFKILSPLLPAQFQYFGIWILTSFVLQGIASYFLLFELTRNERASFVGSLFFILSPHFLFRYEMRMISLSSHWLIIFFFYVSVSKKEFDKKFLLYSLLNFLTIYTHPYLAIMTLSFSLWTILLDRDHPVQKRVGYSLLLTVIAGLLFCTLGYFDGSPTENVGFGAFSADLTTFINSFNRGLLPGIMVNRDQLEGMAYLGFGAIAAALISVLALKNGWSQLHRNLRLMGVLCVLFFIFSLSSVVTFAGTPIANLTEFYKLLGPIPGMLRASGRFTGPLHYLILAGSITLITFKWQKRALAILVALFIFQLVDLGQWVSNRSSWVKDRQWNSATSTRWTELLEGKENIFLVPLRYEYINCYGLPIQSHGFNDADFYTFSLLASRHHMTINSGFEPRGDVLFVMQRCAELPRHFKSEKLEDQTLFIVHRDYFQQFEADVKERLKCEPIDGYHACYSN